ncbi:unnamed protein product [Parnassius apollo]|uniref:(apollo) hypothetical protein n=1 Tax=Parnassius apollo TaxID=110799 RepID=A0A8S3WAV8_PARAO|nr:unnamed protein product [Parnassius apollo]
MHRLFAELEPSLIVTEQNLADRVRYILRSNIFDVAELERLRREAVPSSDENATAEDAAPQMVEQPANVDAAVNTPVVVDSNDDGTVAQELELEHMRSILEEAIVETRSTPLENRPRLPRIALSKRNRAVVRALNPMLVTYLEASRDLCETDSILFGAALAVCRIIGAKVSTAGRATGHSSAIPAWRRRIEERIAKARALIGRLICFRSGNNRPRIVRTVRMAFAGTNVSLSQPDITQKLTERIDDLKQRIAAWGKRIRRYTERSTRFNQNRLFQSDQKRLYESLERPMVSGTGPAPDQADTVAFWRGLWSEPVNHSEGPWTEVVASQCAGITPMDPVIITPDDVAEAVRRAPNWKSPGLDGLHHYWLKGFMVCHSVLARQFQEALNQKSLPSLFTTGITHLVPKDQGTTDPSKYRPITDEPELSNIRRRSSETDLSTEQTLLVNPDCHVRVMLEYIRKKCRLGIYTHFDLCDETGALKELFSLPAHTNVANLFEHRKTYYIIVLKQETDKRLIVLPQLNHDNKIYSDLKAKVKRHLLSSESSHLVSSQSKISPSLPSKTASINVIKPSLKKNK